MHWLYVQRLLDTEGRLLNDKLAGDLAGNKVTGQLKSGILEKGWSKAEQGWSKAEQGLSGNGDEERKDKEEVKQCDIQEQGKKGIMELQLSILEQDGRSANQQELSDEKVMELNGKMELVWSDNVEVEQRNIHEEDDFWEVANESGQQFGLEEQEEEDELEMDETVYDERMDDEVEVLNDEDKQDLEMGDEMVEVLDVHEQILDEGDLTQKMDVLKDEDCHKVQQMGVGMEEGFVHHDRAEPEVSLQRKGG